jgi:prolyl oligopeptidase
MDAYHKVKDGIRYPAVLFLGGMNAPRVLPFFSAKMTARLQAATASQRPVLLDFDDDAGHIGSSQEQLARQDADQFAFLLAQVPK